jgi:predicted secreted protein
MRFNTRLPALALSVWCLCGFSFTLAQNQLSLGQLQPGQLVLNLSATEQQQVAQDTLNATLEFAVQGRDKIALQDQVNSAMQQALEELKAEDSVHYQSAAYQVYIIQSDPGRFNVSNPVWRAQQSLQLDSLDSAALLDLVGKLQGMGLTVNNLYYSLSSAKYETVAAELTSKVLITLQHRADAAATGLQKTRAELVEVSLDGNSNFIAYRGDFQVRAMAADSSEIAPPVADPGETQVSVTVAARAILSP